MTEQEKRENAIEEMYKELAIEGVENPHALYAFCIVAINAGYRKEDEVKNETAKEIRNILLERLDAQENMLLRLELAAMIVKIETVFGVEVEE